MCRGAKEGMVLMRTSNRKRDSACGTAMLTLRTTISLSRVGLANHLGVSRQAVGDWEAGRSYPKAEHLKGLIALAVQQQAFATGHEVEEVRALWKVTRQKTLLDERWLSALLSGQCSSPLHVVPSHVAGQAQGTVPTASVVETTSSAPAMARRDRSGDLGKAPDRGQPCPPLQRLPEPLRLGPRVDWGDALAVPVFYGREEELALLSQWVLQERCRVVSVLGMGGIGKSALVVSTMYRLAEHFDVVIFRSLRDAPSCETLLDDCLQVLDPQSWGQSLQREAVGTAPNACGTRHRGGAADGVGRGWPLTGPCVPCATGLHDPYGACPPLQAQGEQRIDLLLKHLRESRVLVVLDNLECLLEAGDVRGHFRPGFEEYGRLLHRVTEKGHQSCWLVTSREKPAELSLLEAKHCSVRSLRLTGLDVIACQRLLEEKGVIPESTVAPGFTPGERLIEIYGGNPLALMIVAATIVDLFGGEIGEFLAGGTVLLGSITELLGEQFVRLSALEQSTLCWLTIVREPVTLDELLTVLSCGTSPPATKPRTQALEAVDGLRRRSLIERGKRPGSFTLQSVVLEYVTEVLIAEGSREILQGRLNRLIQHSLEQAHAKEYVRQTQERLLVAPLLAELQTVGTGSAQDTIPTAPVRRATLLPTSTPTASVEEQLLSLLDQLRGGSDTVQGYGPANLIALLQLQRGHLSGLDLSQLFIRGAYWQNIEMQDTSLAGSRMRDTVFAEAVSATWAVAISLDGRLWAAGGMQGKVRVWDEGGQILQRIWQAHTDMVQTLAFSPDGRTLASGSMDGTVKLWEVNSGILLWTSWQDCPQNLAFTPDSTLLVSAGSDATVRLWDPQSGTNLQTLRHPCHVFAVAWSPDGSLLASSCFDGELRLWKRQKADSSTNTLPLQFLTNWAISPAAGLAFAPDGRTLASASWDQTVRLWEVGSHGAGPRGCLLHTLSGQTNQSSRVAWSPDGRTLASSSHDKAIWLWDVEQRRCRAALVGHSADIDSMAFTPDSSRLLSGSGDSTLRVWDVGSGQCVRVIAGYGVSLYDLDWSPNGTHVLSGGTDAQVTIWDIRGETPPKVLYGHHRVVSGVGWSPDERFVASCGWDGVMRLWDPTTLSCIQKFEETSAILLGMAWSPDGRLLASGTYLRGMQVWDVRAGCLRWIGQPQLVSFCHVAWSPDGTRLASGGDDGVVYLWEGTDGTLLQQLSGHHGRVMSVVWSPDGTQLASGSGSGGDGELFVWDVQSGERIQTFAGHYGMVSAVAWSPCRNWLISGGSDGRLRRWDVQSGVCVSIQVAHQGTIQSLRVSPDGRLLASCGDDGAIMIWDLCGSGQARGSVPTGETLPLLRTLRRDRPYERLNITGIRGLNEAQKATLQALGAISEAVPTVAGHSAWTDEEPSRKRLF
jgi:WD40 repeat protein/DNA-binding XRE family transcriptional regulator